MKNKAEDKNGPVLSESDLRKLVQDELLQSGWEVSGNRFIPPQPDDKQSIRDMHQFQRMERSQTEHMLIRDSKHQLLAEFANGDEVNPNEFSPELIKVDSNTWDNSVFRFATLLWSVPVSRGYGRRMRYLVRDKSNGKLVGIFALMDPVFNLKVRDQHIGWNAKQRENYLYHVMDAYILGAVPPYNYLLGGKMIALATVSDEVRKDFRKKYSGQITNIRQEKKKPELVLVTTTSALGRSSIYNRIKLPEENDRVFQSLGFSEGWGHFQISETTFHALRNWLRSIGDPYADGYTWDKTKSSGPNWKLRTIRRAMDRLGFDGDSLKHGIKREVYIAPLASNYLEYLCGKVKRPKYYKREIEELASYYKDRWMIPRSQRTLEWRTWTRENTWSLINGNIGQLDMPVQQLHLFK